MSRFSSTLTNRIPLSHSRPSILNWALAAWAAHRSRMHLSRLDADQLKDIGISKNDAMSEAKRPIWDVPSHWTQ